MNNKVRRGRPKIFFTVLIFSGKMKEENGGKVEEMKGYVRKCVGFWREREERCYL